MKFAADLEPLIPSSVASNHNPTGVSGTFAVRPAGDVRIKINGLQSLRESAGLLRRSGVRF